MDSFTRLPRTQLLIGMSVIIVIASLFANIVDVGNSSDDSGSVGGWIGLSLFGIAVTALLLLVAVPRIPAESRRTAVLAFGIAAAITCVVFWSMLPFALAAGALSAAHPGDDAAEGEAPAPATAGVILALLAVVAAFVFCIIG
jgi:hypothetical protein